MILNILNYRIMPKFNRKLDKLGKRNYKFVQQRKNIGRIESGWIYIRKTEKGRSK